MKILNILRTAGSYALQAIALLVALACLAFLVLVFVAPANAAGTVARLTWTHPTQRIDDSPLAVAQIRETLIEWRRTAAGPVVGSVRVAAPATTVDVPGLVCGDFVFTAATIATDALSSSPTGPVAYATGISCVPKSPTGLSAS